MPTGKCEGAGASSSPQGPAVWVHWGEEHRADRRDNLGKGRFGPVVKDPILRHFPKFYQWPGQIWLRSLTRLYAYIPQKREDSLSTKRKWKFHHLGCFSKTPHTLCSREVQDQGIGGSVFWWGVCFIVDAFDMYPAMRKRWASSLTACKGSNVFICVWALVTQSPLNHLTL